MKCMICGSQMEGVSRLPDVFGFIDGLTDTLRRKFGVDASDLRMGAINSIRSQSRIRQKKEICKKCVFDTMEMFSTRKISEEIGRIRRRYFSI